MLFSSTHLCFIVIQVFKNSQTKIAEVRQKRLGPNPLEGIEPVILEYILE